MTETHQYVPDFLPDIMIEPPVKTTLLEDLGRAGDITTHVVVPPGLTASAAIVAREAGSVADTGVDLMSVGWLPHSSNCLDLGLDMAQA